MKRKLIVVLCIISTLAFTGCEFHLGFGGKDADTNISSGSVSGESQAIDSIKQSWDNGDTVTVSAANTPLKFTEIKNTQEFQITDAQGNIFTARFYRTSLSDMLPSNVQLMEDKTFSDSKGRSIRNVLFKDGNSYFTIISIPVSSPTVFRVVGSDAKALATMFNLLDFDYTIELSNDIQSSPQTQETPIVTQNEIKGLKYNIPLGFSMYNGSTEDNKTYFDADINGIFIRATNGDAYTLAQSQYPNGAYKTYSGLSGYEYINNNQRGFIFMCNGYTYVIEADNDDAFSIVVNSMKF